jgi:hypothetical protein
VAQWSKNLLRASAIPGEIALFRPPLIQLLVLCGRKLEVSNVDVAVFASSGRRRWVIQRIAAAPSFTRSSSSNENIGPRK